MNVRSKKRTTPIVGRLKKLKSFGLQGKQNMSKIGITVFLVLFVTVVMLALVACQSFFLS